MGEALEIPLNAPAVIGAAGLDGDFLSVAIALVVFAALLLTIELLDRI